MIASISAGIIHSLIMVRTSSKPECSARRLSAPRTTATMKSASRTNASRRRAGSRGGVRLRQLLGVCQRLCVGALRGRIRDEKRLGS